MTFSSLIIPFFYDWLGHQDMTPIAASVLIYYMRTIDRPNKHDFSAKEYPNIYYYRPYNRIILNDSGYIIKASDDYGQQANELIQFSYV